MRLESRHTIWLKCPQAASKGPTWPYGYLVSSSCQPWVASRANSTHLAWSPFLGAGPTAERLLPARSWEGHQHFPRLQMKSEGYGWVWVSKDWLT